VVDPIRAIVNVQNYLFAVSQQAQTSLRSIIGQSEMDQLLAERDPVNRELRRIIDELAEGRGASGSSGWRSRTSRCPRA
jgi:regulator of protease activity HflC (stomatin/prohibitin superfamily)